MTWRLWGLLKEAWVQWVDPDPRSAERAELSGRLESVRRFVDAVALFEKVNRHGH